MSRNQSVAETTFGKMSGLIGSFITYPKKDESRESLRRQDKQHRFKSKICHLLSSALIEFLCREII